jgi:hypothetical protein
MLALLLPPIVVATDDAHQPIGGIDDRNPADAPFGKELRRRCTDMSGSTTTRLM